ncbi:MAG: hypothetical protein Ta2B_25130 [Termitinemataceae bacterium]|nr:MAG: hypothetical protein Ta2B_25130 [Termitinemataceae bacterium]
MKNEFLVLFLLSCTFFVYAQETEKADIDLDTHSNSSQILNNSLFKVEIKAGVIIDCKKYSDERTLNGAVTDEYFYDSFKDFLPYLSFLIAPYFEYKNIFLENKTEIGSVLSTKAVLGYVFRLAYFDFAAGAGIFYGSSKTDENGQVYKQIYEQNILAPSVNIKFQKDFKTGLAAIVKAAYYPYMFINVMDTLPAEKYYIKAAAMGFDVEAGCAYRFKNSKFSVFIDANYAYYLADNGEIAADTGSKFSWMRGASARLENHNLSIDLGVSYAF